MTLAWLVGYSARGREGGGRPAPAPRATRPRGPHGRGADRVRRAPRDRAPLTMPLQNRVTPLGDLVAAPRPRSRLRQPRLPPRRVRPDPATLRREALDRLPAAVPRLAPQPAAAARSLHRAVLPRRGDGVRRGTPAVRALPPRGLQPARSRSGASSIPARSAPTRSTRSSTASARGPRDETPTRRAFPTARSSSATASRGSCSARSSCAGRRRATRSARPRPAGRAALVTPPSLVAVLRSGWEPLVPLLHPSAG